MIFSLFTTATLVSLAHPAHAQSTYTLLEPLPTITETGASVMGKEINLNDYINYAINLLIAISAAAAVFMIVWGGLLYMTTDSWNGKSDGKEKVTNAIIGLLMVLSTYIILKTVNPALVAIPDTLVPELKLDTSRADALYSRLQGELAGYDAAERIQAQQIRDINANINKNRSTIDQLNTELANLYADGYNEFDPIVEAVKKDIEETNNDISKLNGQRLITAETTALTGQLKQAIIDINNPDKAKDWKALNAIIDEYKTQINNIRSSGAAKLAESGQDPAPLYLQANYADASLELERIRAIINNASFGSINSNNVYVGYESYLTSGAYKKEDVVREINNYISNASTFIDDVKNTSDLTDATAIKLKADLNARLQNIKTLAAEKFK